jgi:glycosyltransferase involved in cell wall biosynthesis
MKIAVILPRLANQGPIIVAKDIVGLLLIEKDVNIDVYYFDELVELTFGCKAQKISFFNKINFNDYDVVHSHMLRSDAYVWFHRKKSDTKTLFISTLHQNIYDNLKGNYNSLIAIIFEKIWLKFLKRQDYVVTLTKVMQNTYLSKLDVSLKTIYNGRNLTIYNNGIINNEDLIQINLLKNNYTILGTHCLLTKRKGIDQIIKSLVILKEYALILVGDGKEFDNLVNLAKELNVFERCIFLGYKIDATSYLKYFDIYVMSSYSEGFPLGLLEAGMSKLPVVCSDLPIFRELFSKKEVVFFELNNIKSFANSITFCQSNKDYFSNSIYETINIKYSNKIMASKYFDIYNSK